MTPVGEILVSLMDDVRLGLSLPELLCRDACRKLPISAAGIALMNRDGVIESMVGSDERAETLEELQLTLGEGPCVDAFTTGRLALHPDVAARGAERWPAYARAVLDMGVQALFSFPLRIGGIRFGALDMFRDETGRFDDDEFSLALHYVDAAVQILLYLQANDRAEPVDEPLSDGSRRSLEVAFRGHPEVHQATGMVSIQAGVGLIEALLLLRAYAFANERTVPEVARDVVELRLTFK
jgi:hypothetical protein